MKLLKNDASLNVDIDKTLIFDLNSFGISSTSVQQMGIPMIDITNPYDGITRKYAVHQEHVDLIKAHKGRGFFVALWSNNGAEYAYAVGKALNLEAYVDLAMSKPTKICDDLPAEHFMPDSIYIKDNLFLKAFLNE